MDTRILEDLGLTQAEIKVYVALLELGSSGAGVIIQKSGLQNSVVHRALNSLLDKALIGSIKEGKRNIYQATDPNHFFDFIEDKKHRFEELLPELKLRQSASRSDTEPMISTGRRGIMEIYNRLLDSGGKEYLTFGGGKQVTFDVMGEEWWKRLHTKRIAKKIPARQVFDETILEFGRSLNKRKLSKVRFLPQQSAQLTETIILGDYVALVMFTENPYGVIIRDQTVADSYRKNFEIVWEKAKR